MTKVVDKKYFVDAKNNKKQKLKKNAMEVVDKELEFKLDPKFKTELCKSWVENEFCVYGNKCRFAHGNLDKFVKQVNKSKYKLKDCSSFFQSNYCNYGSRCHFKHDERKLNEINVPYYSYQLMTNNYLSINIPKDGGKNQKRLRVFKDLELVNSNCNDDNKGFHVIMGCNCCKDNLEGRAKSDSQVSQVNKSNEIGFHAGILSHFY